LTLADVETLLPNITATFEPDPLITGDFYLYPCQWGAPQTNPGVIVELDLYGARTPAGKASLDTNFWGNPDAGAEAVTGVGTKAQYVNVSGSSQTLAAQSKSYWIGLTVRKSTPDVAESSLQPLVVKVIGEL
jgi:hypothetical protein